MDEDEKGESGNQKLNEEEEEEEDGIERDRLTKTMRDLTVVEGDMEKHLETVEKERGGSGNLRLSEVLLAKAVMF